MKSDEAMAAEQALESRLAEAGADQIRRGPSFDTAPETGTPAETVTDELSRNELGQFTSTEPADEPEVAATEEQPETVQDGTDPAVAAYLAKYGGDIDKAIQAAAHAQRQLGKQSTEVGQLRAENEQYAEMLSELQGLRSDMQQARSQQPIDQATVDWFDQQAIENPYSAAEYARQQGNQMLLQRALTTWKELDPYSASVYTNNLQNQQFAQQIEEKLVKAQQLPMDATINVALTNVRSRNPQYANYDSAIETAMAKYPSAANAVQHAASGGSTAELEQAIETLYGLAIGDTLQSIAMTGDTPASTSATANVAEPTISEPHEPAPEPTGEQRFRDAFRQETEQRRRGVFVAE